jgi:hypothetical protein
LRYAIVRIVFFVLPVGACSAATKVKSYVVGGLKSDMTPGQSLNTFRGTRRLHSWALPFISATNEIIFCLLVLAYSPSTGSLKLAASRLFQNYPRKWRWGRSRQKVQIQTGRIGPISDRSPHHTALVLRRKMKYHYKSQSSGIRRKTSLAPQYSLLVHQIRQRLASGAMIEKSLKPLLFV